MFVNVLVRWVKRRINQIRRSEELEPVDADEPDRLLKPAEVTSRFGVSPSTLRRWDASGILPAKRTPGRHRRWLESRVLAKLRELGLAPMPSAA